MPVRLGIGGFSMGAAAALHSAACYAHGRFTNGVAYPITLSVVVGLSGWLPCSRYDLGLLIFGKMVMFILFLDVLSYSVFYAYLFRTLRSKIENSQTALRRASALPILLNHGRG